MAYRSFKPYTPGRRQMTVSTFEEITATTPENPFWLPCTAMAAATVPAK